VSFDTHAGEIQAVRGVSFHLDEKETLAIVGESGCGKSVTVQTIMKLISVPYARLKSGVILYRGKDVGHLSDKEMESYRGREFSMIFQDSMSGLNPTMRVGTQIRESVMQRRDISREGAGKRAMEMLAQVGLPNPERIYRRYAHTMSGGQRQRVMIAMALSCNPKILFADEPTTALDVTLQAQILDLLNELKGRFGVATVLITHDLGVVAKMADRIAVMYAGKVVEYGDAEQIFYRPSHPYTWGLLSAMPNLKQPRKSELYTIVGMPPDLFAPPPGCAFTARCSYAMEVCRKEEPPEFFCGEGHASACWLLDERAEEALPPPGIPRLVREESVNGR
jgi:oligopeptide transport system ATP-binding protein